MIGLWKGPLGNIICPVIHGSPENGQDVSAARFVREKGRRRLGEPASPSFPGRGIQPNIDRPRVSDFPPITSASIGAPASRHVPRYPLAPRFDPLVCITAERATATTPPEPLFSFPLVIPVNGGELQIAKYQLQICNWRFAICNWALYE